MRHGGFSVRTEHVYCGQRVWVFRILLFSHIGSDDDRQGLMHFQDCVSGNATNFFYR